MPQSKGPFVRSETVHAARDGTRHLTAEALWSIPRVGAPVLAPDGRSLAVPVTTFDIEDNRGRSRIWLVPVEGGEPRALTSSDASSSSARFSPDGTRLAFLRKESEDDKPQVFVIPLDGGEAARVTEFPLGVFDAKWLPDSSGLVVAAPLYGDHPTPEATRAERDRREEDPVKAHVTEKRFFRFWDRWLTTGDYVHFFHVDLDSGALRDLTPESERWVDWMNPQGQFDVSPQGDEIAFAAGLFDDERERVRWCVFTVPFAGGEVACLTREHPASDFRPRYTPDGAAIVYGMKHDPDFYADRLRLMRYDRASGTHAPLLEEWELSPTSFEVSASGSLRILAELDARMAVFRLEEGGAAPREVVRDGWVGDCVEGLDGTLFFDRQSLSEPAEVYALEPGGTPRRLTRFTEDALADVALGEVRDVRFTGGGGAEVQMFVLLPPDGGGRNLPLVQCVHGGPHGVSGDFFHYRWNPHTFAVPGYAVACVNFQGSTSWGQDFAARIQGAWAELPYEDIMAATDALIASGIADASRLAAAGGSYGGYLVSWIAAHTNRFRCIVNHAGVYNLLSHFASDMTQGRARAYGGAPWDGIERIDRFNPARFTASMETPMLVIHGEKDYRVPVSQGLECYSVLKAKGVEARLIYFPDENHWVLKPRNALLWNREVLDWFARFLDTGS